MEPYKDTFLFHWIDSNGDRIPQHDFRKIQACKKWHAFCFACGIKEALNEPWASFIEVLKGPWAFYVGSGEAHDHTTALHLLNTMYLNHAFHDLEIRKNHEQTTSR